MTSKQYQVDHMDMQHFDFMVEEETSFEKFAVGLSFDVSLMDFLAFCESVGLLPVIVTHVETKMCLAQVFLVLVLMNIFSLRDLALTHEIDKQGV